MSCPKLPFLKHLEKPEVLPLLHVGNAKVDAFSHKHVLFLPINCSKLNPCTSVVTSGGQGSFIVPRGSSILSLLAQDLLAWHTVISQHNLGCKTMFISSCGSDCFCRFVGLIVHMFAHVYLCISHAHITRPIQLSVLLSSHLQ